MSRSFVRPQGLSVSRIIFCGSLLTFGLTVGLILAGGKNLLAVGEREFVELSGAEAQEQLARELPAEIDPADVRRISVKRASTADSRAVWSRVKVSPTVAAVWEEAVHEHVAQLFTPRSDRTMRGVEAVSSKLDELPPPHGQTEARPGWWSPPSIEFRVTEAMAWFDDAEAGSGRAIYSAYDARTGLLWVYEYSGERETFWPRGQVSSGQYQAALPKPAPAAREEESALGGD